MKKDFKKWIYAVAIILILVSTAIYLISKFRHKTSIGVNEPSVEARLNANNISSEKKEAPQSQVVFIGGEVESIDENIFSVKTGDSATGESGIVKIAITGEVTKYKGSYDKQGGFESTGKEKVGSLDIKIGDLLNVALDEPVGVADIYIRTLSSSTATIMPALPAGIKPL